MVAKDIKSKILKGRCGTIYFSDSFPQYDTEYVRKILSKMVADGILKRISNGIFIKPVKTRFGILYPDVETIVKAIAKRDHALVIAEGNSALHQLGLSTQVPTKYVYLTNGSARTLKLGNQEVKLKRGTPNNFAFNDPFMATLHQALSVLGRRQLTSAEMDNIKNLYKTYSNPKHQTHDMALLPVWMRKLLSD